LKRCLAAILDQDYPRFELRIVVDHRSDPAMPVVEDVLSSRPAANAIVQQLSDPLGTCSLKCSSLIQAVAGAEPSAAFVAQLDADTIPHRSWLRELATALSDEHVGAATGNRWYMPDNPTWGSLVRYAWNSAAVVLMHSYRIAWGGTLAIRTSVIRDAGLLDRWSRAFCEDTMLFRILRDAGWEVRFVPSLMMVNRESCDLAGFVGWVQRQLLTARLYHPSWWAVVAHGWGTSLGLLATLLVLAYALAASRRRARKRLIGWI
jgi:cellulose synthase/poly-beta-1,6-N-acetylglucosamine synthase-like glycosyltransferase